MARTTKQDKVRELQRTLYRAAKADPGRRFHALYDKIYRRDVLEHAWELVRANRGAAGIDRQTIADVEQYGVSRLLDELAADLKDGRWRPLPARRVLIPKPGRPQERRPLSIPTVISYCCVLQRAFGFVGGHASVPSAGRAAARGFVCAS
jgi:RNA-directed DNA polymerase